MTNTMYIPTEIEQALVDAQRIARRIELVKRYADEAQLQGLAPDEGFAGADLVAIAEDFVLAFEVVDWSAARVRLTLSHLVDDGDDFRADDVWSVELVEAPWQVFSMTLQGALRALHGS